MPSRSPGRRGSLRPTPASACQAARTASIASFFTRHDVWLTPTLAGPPLPIGHFSSQPATAEAWAKGFTDYCPFTYPFNVTGQPAASLPLFWTEAGLPIGCQIAGRSGDEATLVRLSAQLERARPWFARRPPGSRR